MTMRFVGWSLFSHMLSTGPMDRRSDIAHTPRASLSGEVSHRRSARHRARSHIGTEVTPDEGGRTGSGSARSATADEPAPDRLDPQGDLGRVGLVQGRSAT